MSSLSIKDVPEALAEKLRQRAARNHRSLQGELMSLIEAAVAEESAVISQPYPTADREARRQRLFTIMQEAAPYSAADRLSRDEAHKR